MEEHLTKDEKKKLRQEEWKKELDTEHKRKIRNRFITWGIGAAILAFAVWFLVVVVNQPTPSATTQNIKMPPITSKDITDGPTTAPLQLVEYADFQCPSCKLYYPIVKQLQQDFKGKIIFVYRFFPLSNIHQNAVNAAEAAYAANKQGKFWEMHDKLFDTQDSWATDPNARSSFATYAQQLGLNMSQFNADFNASSTEKTIKDTENADLDLGLNGTPTFFLNGKQLTNPGDYNSFKQLLQTQLQAK